MNELQTKRRRPSTYTAYRVEEPKSEKKQGYDWYLFPLHLFLGWIHLMMFFVPILIVASIVFLYGWKVLGIIVASILALWGIGRYVTRDIQ